MKYFPFFMELSKQPVLLVGGGEVAERKLDLLLKANAKLTIFNYFSQKKKRVKNVVNFGPRGILRYSLDETDRMDQSGAWDFAAEFKIDIF